MANPARPGLAFFVRASRKGLLIPGPSVFSKLRLKSRHPTNHKTVQVGASGSAHAAGALTPDEISTWLKMSVEESFCLANELLTQKMRPAMTSVAAFM